MLRDSEIGAARIRKNLANETQIEAQHSVAATLNLSGVAECYLNWTYLQLPWNYICRNCNTMKS